MNPSRKSTSVITSICLVFVLSLLLAPHAEGQQRIPKLEVYGGYSLLRPNLPSGITGSDKTIEDVAEFALSNILGWNAGVTANLTNSFGVTADFSGYYKSLTTEIDGDAAQGNLHIHSFLFGPKFTKNGDKLRPFAHALFGYGRASAEAQIDREVHSAKGSAFAAALGGGLDIVVHRNVAIRAIGFDYFPARHSDGGTLSFHNVRWGTGIVFYH